MKKYVAIAAIVVIITVIILLKCLPNEKKNVVRDLKTLAKNVEQEDKPRVLDHFDPGYADSSGMNYENLSSLLDNLFKEADSIHVALSEFKVYLDSSRGSAVFARCSLGVRVWANYGSDKVLLFGGVIKPSPVLAYLTKTEETYRVYSASY
jgi:hypothetical protein